MSIKPFQLLFRSAAVITSLVILSACGSPQPSIMARNVIDTTITTAQSGDYVAIWLLYGTPTLPRGSTGGASTPSTNPATAANVQTKPAATIAPAKPSASNLTSAPAATTAPVTAVPTTATVKAGMQNSSSASAAGSVNGDPARGKQIFNGAGTCSTCHDVSNGATIIGPSLKGVGTRAATRMPGMSAVDYLRESITKPNAFVVPNFQAGLMPQTFGQMLSTQQINDVIAYLLTLK